MNEANYVRLFSDESGESHFEECRMSLSPVDFAPPSAPLNVATFLPATATLWVGAHSGWGGDTPHPTPRRQIFCTVQGEYTVTASNGEARSFPVGSVLLLEDTQGKGHSTRIMSDQGALVSAVALEAA